MLQFSTRSELAMQKRSFTLRRRPLWASLWPTLRKYDNNVGGSLSLFRAMIDAGCRTLVFSSSCAVYGEPKNQPIGEASPMAPCNPYGASKFMVERILSQGGTAALNANSGVKAKGGSC